MDMGKQAYSIYRMPITKQEKIKRLEDLVLDCYNEMEAQDQNMHPEIRHNTEEGFRLAKIYLRELKHTHH